MNRADSCQGPKGKEVVLEHADERAPTRAPAQAHAKAEKPVGERRLQGDPNFSPDPLSQTDRYRLVTPVPLRP